MTEQEIDSIIQDYITESNALLSIREVRESVEFVQPLINSFGLVGFFGYDVVPSDRFGKVAVIKLVYMFPEHRKTFKPVVLGIFKYLEEQGLEHIEMHLNRKINNWFRKHIGSMARIYVHFGETRDYLRRLE